MQIESHLRKRSCPVCGSDDDSREAYPSRIDKGKLGEFAFASRKLPEFMHLRLVRCGTCDVLYASPAPSADFLAEAYRDAAYDSSEEADYAARTYAGILGSLLPSLGAREVALEVGAGSGAFLQHLINAGFGKVIGVEPSRKAVLSADPAIQRLIRLQMFSARDFQPRSVNLLCCFQTLEHLENPRRLCSDAFDLIRPEGAIFLVAHDYQSRLARLVGERSPIFDIEHLQLFSRKSLRFLLESCGFRDVELGTVSNCYPLAYWIKLLPVPVGLKRKVVPLSRGALLGRIPLSANVGNIYAVGFKRAGAGPQPIQGDPEP